MTERITKLHETKLKTMNSWKSFLSSEEKRSLELENRMLVRRKVLLQKKDEIESYEKGKKLKNDLRRAIAEYVDGSVLENKALVLLREFHKMERKDIVGVSWREEMAPFISQMRSKMADVLEVKRQIALNLHEKIYSVTLDLKKIPDKSYREIAADLGCALDMDLIPLFDDWSKQKIEREKKLAQNVDSSSSSSRRECTALRKTKKDLEEIARSKTVIDVRKTFPRTWDTLFALHDFIKEKLSEKGVMV